LLRQRGGRFRRGWRDAGLVTVAAILAESAGKHCLFNAHDTPREILATLVTMRDSCVSGLRFRSLCEAFEEVMRVHRAGRRLGMVLHAEDILVRHAQAAIGAVEQR